jgi:cell volume regulation protein A
MNVAASEPVATAALLTTVAILLGISALFGRAFERMGVPIVLGFLAIGVAAGLPAFGNITVGDYHFAFRIGVIALVLIIFEGGLNTTTKAFRRVAAPALTLATLGVVVTAAIVAIAATLLGVGRGSAMLLGAVVASTDAAAVFSVLRGSRTQLNHRVATTLEVESGINDPVAILLTLAITEYLVGGSTHTSIPIMGLDVLLELAIGAVIGVLIARLALLSFKRLRPPSGGLMAVVTTSIALLSFGAATLLHGSGFVAVYAAAITLGNGRLPMRSSVIRFHDAFGWLSQITMFLLLGLLALPERVAGQIPLGFALAFVLTFIARPIAVLACLLPFRFSLREVLFIGWVGLRGAVPIVLAIYPVLAGLGEGEAIFDVVFVIVVLNAIIPGSTVRAATRLFKLEAKTPPPPSAVMQIEAAQILNADVISFFVTPAIAAAGVSLAELPFPEGAAVAMIVRGDDLIPPKGSTILEPGDHVYVITRSEDLAEIQLLFGKPEAD